MNMIDKLKFDEKGLIPAIVVDGTSGQVLTLAYMNRESLELSIKEGRTCFYSRSRQALWRKGETSGAVQHIIDITADCDYDALVVRVNKDGPACHTGAESCFHNPLWAGDEAPVYEIADLAYHVMVLMLQLGISLEDVEGELAKRHVIDKKVKQEKMV